MTPPAVVLASADPLTIRAVSAAFEEEGVPLLVMPPTSCSSSAFLTSSWPKISGATDLASWS